MSSKRSRIAWIFTLLLCPALIAAATGFGGCGGSDSAATPEPTPTPSPSPTPTPTPSPTPTPTPSPTPTPDPGGTPTATNHDIVVGPGFTDVGPHQLVRTQANVLYLVVPTCQAFFPNCGDTELKVYGANGAGTPSGFSERDGAHAPSGRIGSSAIAIDSNDQIHVLWNDVGGHVRYGLFDTRSDRWGDSEVLDSTNWTDFRQGDQGVAVALDAGGAPHAVWSVRGDDGKLHIHYANRSGGNWHQRRDLDDVVDCDPQSDGCSAWHPAIAFAPDGSLLVAWLNGTGAYTQDGTIRVRRRDPAGEWGDSTRIDDKAQSGLDNGPSILVTDNGVVHLTFCDRGNRIRYWYDDGRGFRGDRQPADQISHNPSLGPDRDGGVFLYAHGTPVPGIGDIGEDLFSFHKPKGATAWSAWTLYTRGSYDSSVSTRWAQFFHFHPEQIDVAYWADSYPNVTHVGVN